MLLRRREPVVEAPAPPEPAVMPATVLIGSVTYRVSVDPDDWMRVEHELQRKGDYGHADHDKAVLYVKPDSTPEVQRLSLWHEVMHALCETVMGSPNWHGLGKENLDREESVVRAFESPTLLAIRDNPALVAYLTNPSQPRVRDGS